jgi:uncharacterized protein (DUF427 family)
MAQAIWNDAVLAEGDDVIHVESNAYFPPESLNKQHLRPSSHQTVCGWKGTASYYDVVVGDHVNANAAWFYPEPKPNAASIAGHVAFWKGVEVRGADESTQVIAPGSCRVDSD